MEDRAAWLGKARGGFATFQWIEPPIAEAGEPDLKDALERRLRELSKK